MAEEERTQEELQAEEAEHQQEEAEQEEQEADEPYDPGSSMVAEWGYDRESETLEVTFQNGHTENYPCTPDLWIQARETDSPGKFMHGNFL